MAAGQHFTGLNEKSWRAEHADKREEKEVVLKANEFFILVFKQRAHFCYLPLVPLGHKC